MYFKVLSNKYNTEYFSVLLLYNMFRVLNTHRQHELDFNNFNFKEVHFGTSRCKKAIFGTLCIIGLYIRLLGCLLVCIQYKSKRLNRAAQYFVLTDMIPRTIYGRQKFKIFFPISIWKHFLNPPTNTERSAKFYVDNFYNVLNCFMNAH